MSTEPRRARMARRDMPYGVRSAEYKSAVDVIVIGGAPGVGKSTLCDVLKRGLKGPYFEFSNLRQPHLDETWSNTSPEEEEMAFENMAFVVDNYLKYGYRPVILTDFQDDRIGKLHAFFGHLNYRIFTLLIRQEETLHDRITTRTGGYTNADRALAWNRHVQERPAFPHEHKISADNRSPESLAEEIINSLS